MIPIERMTLLEIPEFARSKLRRLDAPSAQPREN